MNKIGLPVWAILIFPGLVLGNHNTTGRALWNNVYQEYVCDTADGYLWLAEACTFPVRKAIDFLLKHGDNTIELYNADDYTFDDVPLVQFHNENETIDTYLYDYNSIFPYNQDKICTEYMDLARSCMTHYFTNCSSSLNEDVDSFMSTYKNQYCDGSQLHDYVSNQKGVLEQFVTGNTLRAQCDGLSSLYDEMVEQNVCTEELALDSPYAIDADNITEYTAREPDSFYDIQEEYARKLTSAFRCMEVEMRNIGCPTSEAQSLVIFMYNYLVPPGMNIALQTMAGIFRRTEDADSLTTGDEADRDRTTFGIFGNGQLIPAERLDADDRMLCSFTQRWQNLITNKFITVDALPEYQPESDFGATFVSAIEIVLYDGSGTSLAEYSTSDGLLSTDITVLDSKTEIVGSSSSTQLSLQELEDDTLLLTNPLGDVAVTITLYDAMFGIWIRMYDQEIERSYGNLVGGCEEIDTIDIVGFSLSGGLDELPEFGRRRRRRRDLAQECYDACIDKYGETIRAASCMVECTALGDDPDAALAVMKQAIKTQTVYAKSADSAMVENYSGAPALRHPTVMAFVLLFITSVFVLV